MTVLRNADMITVREDDGTLTIVPVDPEAAVALIAIYVPEAECLTFNEAWDLALMRDAEAAAELEFEAEQVNREAEVDVVYVDHVNRELETARLVDAQENQHVEIP